MALLLNYRGEKGGDSRRLSIFRERGGGCAVRDDAGNTRACGNYSDHWSSFIAGSDRRGCIRIVPSDLQHAVAGSSFNTHWRRLLQIGSD